MLIADLAILAEGSSPASRHLDGTGREMLDYVGTDDALAAARGVLVGAFVSVTCWFCIYLLVTP